MQESIYSKSAGTGSEQNDLPAFFKNEPLPETGLVFDVPVKEMENFDYSECA